MYQYDSGMPQNWVVSNTEEFENFLDELKTLERLKTKMMVITTLK